MEIDFLNTKRGLHFFSMRFRAPVSLFKHHWAVLRPKNVAFETRWALLSPKNFGGANFCSEVWAPIIFSEPFETLAWGSHFILYSNFYSCTPLGFGNWEHIMIIPENSLFSKAVVAQWSHDCTIMSLVQTGRGRGGHRNVEIQNNCSHSTLNK